MGVAATPPSVNGRGLLTWHKGIHVAESSVQSGEQATRGRTKYSVHSAGQHSALKSMHTKHTATPTVQHLPVSYTHLTLPTILLV